MASSLASRNLACTAMMLVSAGCADDKLADELLWGESLVSEVNTLASAGEGLGCLRVEQLDATDHGVRFSVGVSLSDSLPREAWHFDAPGVGAVDDGPLDAFEPTATLLVAIATQQGKLAGSETLSTSPVSEVLRVVHPVSASERPEDAFFSDVALGAGTPACEATYEACWRSVHPTFVVVWDDPASGARAYQFLRANLLDEAGEDACGSTSSPAALGGGARSLALDVSFPLLETYATTMALSPEPGRWPEWIDEAAPRP